MIKYRQLPVAILNIIKPNAKFFTYEIQDNIVQLFDIDPCVKCIYYDECMICITVKPYKALCRREYLNRWE